MSTTTSRRPDDPALRRRRRLRWLVPVAFVVVAGAAIALALFQPWKLFIDKRVDEAAPTVATAPSTTLAPATTSVTTTVTTTASSANTASSGAPASIAPASTAVPATATTVATTPAPAVAPAPPAEPQPTSFTSGEHKTTGTVRLITAEDGHKVLRLENLDTSNGPDVHVYLSPGPDGYADGAINIATLKGNKGNQNYDVPTEVDLSKFHSVVIWCKRFSVAFGQAPLPV